MLSNMTMILDIIFILFALFYLFYSWLDIRRMERILKELDEDFAKLHEEEHK